MPAAEAAAPPDLLDTTWVGPVRVISVNGQVISGTITLHFSGQSDPPGLYSGTLTFNAEQPLLFTMNISTNKRFTMVLGSQQQQGTYIIGEGQLAGKTIRGGLRYIPFVGTYEFTLTKQ